MFLDFLVGLAQENRLFPDGIQVSLALGLVDFTTRGGKSLRLILDAVRRRSEQQKPAAKGRLNEGQRDNNCFT